MTRGKKSNVSIRVGYPIIDWLNNQAAFCQITLDAEMTIRLWLTESFCKMKGGGNNPTHNTIKHR